jgi:hypothetical protein
MNNTYLESSNDSVVSQTPMVDGSFVCGNCVGVRVEGEKVGCSEVVIIKSY